MNTYVIILGIVVPLLGILYATGILQKLLRFIYGDFSRTELKKFLLYGVLFFVIIGIYWLLRCVKDPIFNSFIGSRSTWQVKIISLVVVFALVMGYSWLVGRFQRQRLFYAMTTIYIALASVMAILLSSRSFGIYAPQADRLTILGWVSYVMIESFGSLMVVLFYSFMADTTTPEEGKKGYFITATFGQIGAIMGSTLVSTAGRYQFFSVGELVGVAAVTMLLIPLVVRIIMWAVPKGELTGYEAKGHKNERVQTGFLDGLKFLLAHPYCSFSCQF